MPLFTVKVFKAYGGRGSTSTQWSNEYTINTPDALDSAELLADVTRIVNWEKNFHLPNTHFMRAVISTFGPDAPNDKPSAFRVIDQVGTGFVAEDPSTQDEFLLLTLRVRFGSVLGRGGSKFYRGCLTEKMIAPGQDGKPNLVTPPYGFNDNSAQLLGTIGADVLVTPNSKAPDGLPARSVTMITIAGASIRKMNIRRKKVEAHSNDGALKLLGTAIEIAAGLGAFYLTKGRLMTPAARLATVGVAQAASGAFSALLKQVTDGIDGPLPGPL
jgi:hypothetical protein